jgi:hypothetical protein
MGVHFVVAREPPSTLARPRSENRPKNPKSEKGNMKLIFTALIPRLQIENNKQQKKTMKMNRFEKTILLAVTLAAVATGVCNGEIGDTRGLSARRYQMRGAANSDGTVTYARGNWNVIEQFNANGRCDLIEYSHLDKSNLTDNEISMLLQNNSTTASNWTSYTVADGGTEWSDHNYLWAKFYVGVNYLIRDPAVKYTLQSFRIATTAALQRLGLFRNGGTNTSGGNGDSNDKVMPL